MRNRDILEHWKNEIKKNFGKINFKIDINFEDTIDEEFYFFINLNEEIVPYGFYDDCGYGIGLHFKEKKISHAYYFNELGLNNNNDEEMLLRILIDIVGGEKLFVEHEKKNYSIDFSKYSGNENLKGFSNYKRLSIYEIFNK